MNAHSHTNFESGIPENGKEGLVGGCYEITLGRALGEFSAGDVLIFDTDEEPGAGVIVALRRDGLPGVQVGHLVTDLPTSRWADLPFGDELRKSAYVFAFTALGDDIPRIIDMAELAGIDMCVDIRCASTANENTFAPKVANPTPARDAKGRFLPQGHTEPEAEVEPIADNKRWNKVSDWTPTESFMFDLEGKLYELTALSATLEALLTPLTNKMAGHDRSADAAIDYTVTHLADAVEELEERYMAVRFPNKEVA
jgi:hypothetical protein